MRWEWGKGDVLLADGGQFGTIDRAAIRTRAEVQVDGQWWSFRAVGRELHGLQDEALVMRCRKTSWFKGTQEITAPGGTYVLARAGWVRPLLIVSRGGQWIGEVTRAGWGNRPVLDASDEMPAAEAAFVLWVARVLWTRDDGSAAAATSAAT